MRSVQSVEMYWEASRVSLTIVGAHHRIANEENRPVKTDKIVVTIGSIELCSETSWVSCLIREFSLRSVFEKTMSAQWDIFHTEKQRTYAISNSRETSISRSLLARLQEVGSGEVRYVLCDLEVTKSG